MQVTTEFKEMFSYSFMTILFIILIIVGLGIYLLATKKKKTVIENIIIPKPKDMNLIKNKYLTEIDKLLNDFTNNHITNRGAYQKLSSLIRNFIFEATNIRVQNYTLEDIKSVNIPILYELVSEYYDPEFSVISKGNIKASIDKTRKVVLKWN